MTKSYIFSLVKGILIISLTLGLFAGSFSKSLSIKSLRSLLYVSVIGSYFSCTILKTRPKRFVA